MSSFGDWDDDDALDHEPADPEQVARRLHRLRMIEGLEVVDWDHLPPSDRVALIEVVGALIAWARRQGSLL